MKKVSNKKVILQICTFWLIITLLVISSNFYVYHSIQKEYLIRTSELSDKISEGIEKTLDSNFKTLRILSKYITEKELNKPESYIETLKENRDKQGYRKLAITTLDGKSYATDDKVYVISDRSYFKEASEGKESVSNVIYSLDDGAQVNVFAVPIYNKSQKVIGVLWASVDTSSFSESINYISNDIELFLIDKQGNLVAGNSEEDNFFELIKNYEGNKESVIKFKQDLQKDHSNFQIFHYKNNTNYMFYKEVGGQINSTDQSWWLLVKIPSTIVEKETKQSTMFLNLISLCLILLFTIGFIIIYYRYKRIHNKLMDLAYTDTATKGKNEYYLTEVLENYKSNKKYTALVSLQIMNLSTIMNINGLNGTEFILTQVYDYLKKYLNTAFISHGHFGDFKFIMSSEEKENIIRILNHIYIENISKVYQIEYKIGVYFLNNINESFSDISTKLNIAKHRSNGNFKVNIYQEEMKQKELASVALLEDIKRGIILKEFKAWYQPKFGKDGKTIEGAEALVRWYKYGSIISPYIFIPLCECNGLIQDIDELVLEDVCRNQREWINKGMKIVPISINLSRNYLDKEDTIKRIFEIIDKYNMKPEYIQFEVTESSLVGNEEKLKTVLNTLREKGFKILLDDFGVGYSSMKTVADLKFDVLKIDKCFVDNIGDETGNHIIEYTVQLARQLQMEVVVEGIEEASQYEFLANLECDFYQGYYFSKPISSIDFEMYLQAD